eukprot:12478939-Alexandrium_andersonii.AAC.1
MDPLVNPPGIVPLQSPSTVALPKRPAGLNETNRGKDDHGAILLCAFGENGIRCLGLPLNVRLLA